MSTQRYTTSKSPTKDATGWVMSFRHPLRKDARGKQGLKIRRGLGTPDESTAQALVDEMNVLLGEPSWHNITKRAEAERRFESVVVRAFFDNIETPKFDSMEIRNQVLPLPTAEEGYSHIMMVGTTGAGKTSLLRQFIGSHPDNDRFPSTSASRTTISDIEVITAEEPSYRAVVTFFNESAVHTYVHECVAEACAALWDESTDERLAEKFLTHRDLRFRLGYIVGSWKQDSRSEPEENDDWTYDENERDATNLVDEGDSALPTDLDLERMHSVLKSYLGRIRALAVEGKQRLEVDLNVDIGTLTGSEKEAAQDLFEEFVQSLPDFDDLVNDIMEEIGLRFEEIHTGTVIRNPNGWPRSWEHESSDRSEFLRVVRQFSSNYAPAFGSLLTPVVDGIRVKGPLYPTFTERRPRLVLLDGEGLGHVGDPAAGVASRIARRFGDVDLILLVDSAKAPMLEAPASVLRAVAASGYQNKLAIAFTHFDLMRGQANLPTFDAQRAHVLSSVYQKLTSLRDVVGQPAVRAIERELDERCYMLGFLDRPLSENNRGPVNELHKLIDLCEAAIVPAEDPQVSPVYDTAGLVLAIQAATMDFRTRWDAILGFRRSGNIRTAHWAEVKALNRRVVLVMDNCEYKELKPVSDFVGRLSESITKFLDKPIRWMPSVSADTESDEALSRVQREVYAQLHEFVDSRVLHVPRQNWMEAFDYRGRGSTFDRARVIQTIYETSAPILGSVLDTQSEQFLREVRLLVHDAIRKGGGELVSEVLGNPANAVGA